MFDSLELYLDSLELEFKLHDSWQGVLYKAWPDLEEFAKNPSGEKPFFAYVPQLTADRKKVVDRHQIQLVRNDGKGDPVILPVPSLRELFRGDLDPGELDAELPPEKYHELIELFEHQWLGWVKQGILDIPRDVEMYDCYSNLRRRPDGRSLGLMHDVLWQSWVYLAATIVVSEAEFVSCMTRVQRSASTFRTSIASTNMYDNLVGELEDLP